MALSQSDTLLKSGKEKLNEVSDGGTSQEIRGTKTGHMFRSAMEKVEHKSRRTKERLTTEFRNAMDGVEKKRQKTKEILSKATTEILYAMEEKDQKSQKRRDLGKGGRVIPADAVPHFREPYVYNATCGSVLEVLFFQRFWIWLSKWIPLRVMPCTLTFTGLSINIICCTILMHYSSDGKGEVPSWAFYLCALNVFVYQTLDALDGKQCNKVQETHLEEMADHGSDSLSSSFLTLTISIALQLGTNPLLMLLFQIVNLLAFYSTHWQTHVTDVVVFGKIDVTEVQCFMIATHLITGYFGQNIWHYRVELLCVEIRCLLVMISIAATILATLGNLRIISGGKTPLDNYVQLPRKHGLQILYPFAPICSWTLLMLLTCYSTNLLETSPILFCITFGFAFSKLVVKLQIANLGKVDCELMDSVLVAPIMMCLNASLCLVPEHTALLSAMVFTLMDFLRHVTYLCWDVCEFQDVYVFTLKYPLGHPKNKAGSRGIYMNGLNNEQIISRIANNSKQGKQQ